MNGSKQMKSLVVGDSVGSHMLGLRLLLEKKLKRLKPRPWLRMSYDEDHECFTVTAWDRTWTHTVRCMSDIEEVMTKIATNNKNGDETTARE